MWILLRSPRPVLARGFCLDGLFCRPQMTWIFPTSSCSGLSIRRPGLFLVAVVRDAPSDPAAAFAVLSADAGPLDFGREVSLFFFLCLNVALLTPFQFLVRSSGSTSSIHHAQFRGMHPIDSQYAHRSSSG